MSYLIQYNNTLTLVWPWSYYNNLRNNYYNYYLRRRYRYKRGKHVAQEAWRCSVCSMLPALLHFSSLTGCHYFACVYTYILETNKVFFVFSLEAFCPYMVFITSTVYPFTCVIDSFLFISALCFLFKPVKLFI